MDTTLYDRDAKAQAEWLYMQALLLGYKSLQELLVRDMPKFVELGALWREHHQDVKN